MASDCSLHGSPRPGDSHWCIHRAQDWIPGLTTVSDAALLYELGTTCPGGGVRVRNPDQPPFSGRKTHDSVCAVERLGRRLQQGFQDPMPQMSSPRRRGSRLGPA